MHNYPKFSASLLLLASLSACSNEMEVLKPVNPLKPEELDDTAPPKPVFDSQLSYETPLGTQNHSERRFRFDVSPYEDEAEQLASEKLYPSHAAAMAANQKSIPSVQTVHTYLKQLDDQIYAGVEVLVQGGLAPTVEPKSEILSGAIARLLTRRSVAADEAIVYAAAALRLGGIAVTLPSELDEQTEESKRIFLGQPAEAKPIGFYTWSEELRAIWQQDRFLQQDISAGAACALGAAIGEDQNLRARYLQLTELYARLTNPLRSSLRDRLDGSETAECAGIGSAAFLGSSRSQETELFDRLYPMGVPESADLMGDLIDAIRSGEIDLKPLASDGWYAHKLFALETMLVTDKSEERAKIAFTARYKSRLKEAFKTMLTQTRETHVKQLGRNAPSSATYHPPTPSFRVEPLPTVYVRNARSYVFLETALEEILGADALDLAPAFGQGGPLQATLRDTLHRARDLFFGLYVVAAQDLGLAPKLNEAGDPARDHAWTSLADETTSWLNALPADPLAASDTRVMVPIASVGAHRWKYWVVIGVRTTIAGYSFITTDEVKTPGVDQESRVPLPTEQFLEVESSAEPLSREELRALCDQHQTADAIRAAIEAR